MPQVRRSALLPYSAAQVFDLVGDIERYPDFLPWCSRAQIVSNGGGEVVAELTIMKGRISERFTTRNVMSYPDSIELHLVQGPFKRLAGMWRFTTLAELGSKVELELDRSVDVPADPAADTSIRQRIDSLCGVPPE